MDKSMPHSFQIAMIALASGIALGLSSRNHIFTSDLRRRFAAALAGTWRALASLPIRLTGVLPNWSAPAADNGTAAHAAGNDASANMGLAALAGVLRSNSIQQPMKAPQGRAVGGLTKRLIDIIIASLALILLAPLILMITALIWLSMGRPILFTHKRIGRHGAEFPCFKFRTMANDGPEILSRHLAANPEAAREWNEGQKLMHDPRVTWLGRLLRKASIDELPQLLNVLRGEMSCIGPRPIIAEELERYGEDAAQYVKARPGLTGLWQVSGRSRLSYPERVALDAHYVRNWSLRLDLKILMKTVPVLLKFDDTA